MFSAVCSSTDVLSFMWFLINMLCFNLPKIDVMHPWYSSMVQVILVSWNCMVPHGWGALIYMNYVPKIKIKMFFESELSLHFQL